MILLMYIHLRIGGHCLILGLTSYYLVTIKINKYFYILAEIYLKILTMLYIFKYLCSTY